MSPFFKSLANAINGLKVVAREELNFKIHIICAVFVVIIGVMLGFSSTEWLFIVVAIAFVVSGEVANTAIEDLCDKVEPNQDPKIGKIKDTMAGFVLVTSLGAIIIGIIVIFNHVS
jgi:diacylglycerol kinase